MKNIILVMAALVLAGCANSFEKAAQALAEREPLRCRVTIEGNTMEFEGQKCNQIADESLRNDAFRACGDLSSESETACVVAVAVSSASSGGRSSPQTEGDLRLLASAIDADARIAAAWIGQIPIVGQLGASYFHSKTQEDYYDFLKEVAQGNQVPANVHITKSDDGGAGGEGGSGRGGDGNQFIIFGDENIAGQGGGDQITQDQEKGIGSTQPDSSFEETEGAPLLDDADQVDPALDFF